MPILEAFDHEDALEPLFTTEFEFLPRIGEYLSIGTPPGYFKYYHVVEVWHRQDTKVALSALAYALKRGTDERPLSTQT